MTGGSIRSRSASIGRDSGSEARARIRVSARPHHRGTETRRRSEARARSQPAQRRQDVLRASWRVQLPAATDRARLHGAGGAVQKHPQRSVGGARDRDRRRSAAVRSRPNEKGCSPTRWSSPFRHQRQGKAQGGTHSELDLTLRPATHERIKADGIRVNPRIDLAPGRYQVRVGRARRVGGQTGTVFYDLEVPDFRKEKLMISGLLLAAPSVSRRQHPAGSDYRQVAAGCGDEPPPISARATRWRCTRRFTTTSPRQPRRIDYAVRLLSEDGGEVFTAMIRDEWPVGSNGAHGDKPWEIYGYPKAISLKGVAPGRYLLRVEAQVRGNVDDAKPGTQGNADHDRAVKLQLEDGDCRLR